MANVSAAHNPSDYNLAYHFGRPLTMDYTPLDKAASHDAPTGQWPAWWRALCQDRHSLVADPLFADPDRDDYRLRPESPAWKLGFQAIPVEKIGPYTDPNRASWPIVEAEGVREKPLISDSPAVTSAAREIIPFPDRLPCAVDDRQDAQVPDRVHLTGMIGTRIQRSAVNRLLAIDVDQLLEGFRHRPGRQLWIGEHVGKWLHAATLAWVYTGDAALRAKLDHTAAELVKCQLDDGYLGTYSPKDRWTEWDVWAHKYNLIGLITYMRYTGNTAPLPACRKMADLLCRTFGDQPGRRDIIAAGCHVGLAPTSVLEPMVWLYRLTGEKRYGEFCRYILRSWEQPNGPHVVSRLLELKRVDKVGNGKAYELLSCINGMLEWYRTTGDPRLLEAALNAWEDIVAKRLYITGTASYGELFHDDFDLPNANNVGETCVTVTWLQLNAHLLRLTGQARYAEQLECVVYNHLCGAQHPDGKAWVCCVDLEGTKPYVGAPDQNCCLSSGPRGMAMIPTFAMTTDANGPVVNFYDPGVAHLRLHNGPAVTVVIVNAYPCSGRMAVTVSPATTCEFSLKLRIPSWCAKPTLRVNGRPADATPEPDGYAAIRRTWQKGDTVELNMTLAPRTLLGDHGNRGRVAVLYGPLVLAADASLTGGVDLGAIALPSSDPAALNFTAEPAPDALKTWPGTRCFASMRSIARRRPP